VEKDSESVAAVVASKCKDKGLKEKTMKGELLFSPCMNAFSNDCSAASPGK
jgi:hypothetical protein